MQDGNRSASDPASVAAPAAGTGAASGELPCWNLDSLYPGPDSTELERDLERAAAGATAFRERYFGRVARLSGAALGWAVADYELLQELLARLRAYADLLHAGDGADPALAQFCQRVHEQTNASGSAVLFFTLELVRIDEPSLAAALAAPELAPYRSWLDNLRAFRPHLLSDELETLLFDQQVAGRAAWHRLYDEARAKWRFEVAGNQLTLAQTLDRLSHPDRAIRRAASEAMTASLGRAAPIVALILNTLAKEKAIEDRWRGFARPVSARNLGNFVEDEVVEALITAVKAAYPRLSHRYWHLKAKILGLERLEPWDRTAPLPGEAEPAIPWERAQALVLDSWQAFSPPLAEIGRRFFDENRIDAAPRPGKRVGAFTHSTVPGVHPYIMQTYLGRDRDLTTLAHELGHGIHQVLAAGQGMLMAKTPIILAETAAVFGEMLSFRALLAAEHRPERRRLILARQIEAMLHNVVRQIAFAEFERRFHDQRREGELTVAEIDRIWRETQAQSLGDAAQPADGPDMFWVAIWHFIHEPFYVYAYAFGECLAVSLYAAYQAAPDGFAERYRALLAAGGTLRHRDLLRLFGLDASNPAFWEQGLDLISGLIDTLEEIG